MKALSASSVPLMTTGSRTLPPLPNVLFMMLALAKPLPNSTS